MKPETILQSDLLDIIFENRNKAYGAYALRKYYNIRLLQALGGTILLVGLFIFLQGIDFTGKVELPKSPFDEVVLTTVSMPEDPKDPIPDEKPKPQQQKATILNATAPVITAAPVETTVATQDEMTAGNLGTKTQIVPSSGPGDPGPVDNGGDKTFIDPAPVEPAVESNLPLDHADIMPSFNGDIVRFLLRHLRQPDNIEEGERIIVRVKFVVTKEGEISDVQVVQAGRRDLDEEVIRVVKKMPRWNPGKQAGKFVPVYFNLPVIFVSNAE